jgi:3-dehydroquinate synthase II
MKEFWVDCRPWNKGIATTAIESGADTLVIEKAKSGRELGRVRTLAPDGDLVPDRDVFTCRIKDKASETEAVELSRKGYVIVETEDWNVIPLENLVSMSDHIIALVKDYESAELALNVLEKGVCGILLSTTDPAVVRNVASLIKSGTPPAEIVPLTITGITPAGMGDRVCVDTCSILSDSEGMLIGNTSAGAFLVHAETLENPYVAPRPFRVNAGAVHAYATMPGGKTAYLSDLKTGDRVLISDSKGATKEATVGRVKIELRPLLLIEAEYQGRKVSAILQNAETIRLVREDGSACSVAALTIGDIVMGTVTESGRHFGVAVKEHIIEK